MFNGPKRLEVPAIENFPVKREIMFVIGLRENILISFTGDVYRPLISVRKLSIRKGKVVAGLLQLLLYHCFAGYDLVTERVFIVGVNHIMVQGVCPYNMSAVGQFA